MATNESSPSSAAECSAANPVETYSSVKFIKCRYCPKVCKTLEVLQMHKEKDHKDLLPFDCGICNKSFATQLSMKIHRGTHLVPKTGVSKLSSPKTVYSYKGKEPKEVLICVYCGVKFRDPKTFESHEIRHSFEITLTCRFCQQRFDRFGQCKRHILRFHMSDLTTVLGPATPKTRNIPTPPTKIPMPKLVSKPLECKMCNLIFGDSAMYQKHMVAHYQRKLPASKEKNSETVQKFLSRVTSLGSEVTLQPLKVSAPPKEEPPSLGLVISSVQSVSLDYFEELDRQSEKVKWKKEIKKEVPEEFDPENQMEIVKLNPEVQKQVFKVSPEVILEFKRSSTSSDEGVRRGVLPDLLKELPKDDARQTPEPKMPPKKEVEEDIRIETIQTCPRAVAIGPPRKRSRVSTPEPEQVVKRRTSSRGTAVPAKEEDQPPAPLKVVLKRTRVSSFIRRRIHYCPHCNASFENLESRKMHIATVHSSKVKPRPGRTRSEKLRCEKSDEEVKTEPFSYIDETVSDNEETPEPGLIPKLKLKIQGSSWVQEK